MISPELLRELKLILLEDCGLKLSKREISEIGNDLVDIFEMLAKVDNYEHENYRNTNS
jgi:hypothetical protein